jgi:DNA-binding helix-hairpin-helix protein with protein kinase domain
MAAVGRPRRATPWQAREPLVVRDSDGNALELDPDPIGRGGQGAVYRMRGTRYAAKLVNEADSPNPGDSLAERLARLRWLPLEGLPVSRPIQDLAAPHSGYIMDLLEGVQPLAALCEPPDGDLEAWYLSGGGLRRRLRLLARLAEVLAALHGRGLVYGDISPDNVLVSATPEGEDVWLIDPDNIAIESSARQRVVETRLYRAPEITRRESGNTPFSDDYSFALLAYQTLRADHPLVGDLVDDDVRLEEDAERGLLPWTGHSTDSRNGSGFGVEGNKVLTSRLKELFRHAFEDGLREPLRRPTATAWAAELRAAADLTVVCRPNGCGHSYYVFAPHCPYCRVGRPETILAGVRDQVPARFGLDGTKPVISDPVGWIALQAGEPFLATTRHARLAVGPKEEPVMGVRWMLDGALALEILGIAPARWVSPAGGAGRLLVPGARADPARVWNGWQVHFGDDRSIHRVLTFQQPRQQEA